MIFIELIFISEFSCLYVAEPFFKWSGVEKGRNHLSYHLFSLLSWLYRQSSDFRELNVLAQICLKSSGWLALVMSSMWKELDICAPDLMQPVDISAVGKRWGCRAGCKNTNTKINHNQYREGVQQMQNRWAFKVVGLFSHGVASWWI